MNGAVKSILNGTILTMIKVSNMLWNKYLFGFLISNYTTVKHKIG